MVCCATARRHGAEVRPLTGRDWPGLGSLGMAVLQLAILAGLLQPSMAMALSPVQGDRIVNIAKLSTAESPAVSSAVAVAVVVRTASTIELFQYAAGVPGSVPVPVPATDYRLGSPSAPFGTLPTPVVTGSPTPVDLSRPVPLLPTRVLHGGDPLFIRVADNDQNLDRTRPDTILVTVTDQQTNDVELLRLTETGPDTGLFTGYLPTSAGSSQPYNGVMNVTEGSAIQVRYVDIVDGSDIATGALLTDPFGIVFNSQTGTPVDGAIITLLDAATGRPATIFGDNGVSSFPATVTSGGTATDASGKSYSFPPGGFRFPFVLPGTYQLRITPPAGYRSPSTATSASIQSLPGGPFTILEPGSRGEQFTINAGPAIRIDIPVDPAAGALWLRKAANRDVVTIGDFLPYELTIENTDTGGPVTGVNIIDRLPVGFRYRQGSTRLNGVTGADPQVSADGRTLTFAVGDLQAKASAVVRYVVEVAAGAVSGKAVNSATATSSPSVSANTATASVLVRDAFLRDRNILMGRVAVGGCSDAPGNGGDGVAGVSIYLEDGTFVISDTRGLFHFEGIRPGSHVVQLDLDSLPAGYEVVPCEENTRFAGRAYSQFVDLQGGSLWRTDFHLARKLQPVMAPEPPPVAPSPASGAVSLELISRLEGDEIVYRAVMHGETVPLDNLHLTVTLPAGASYVAQSSRLNGERRGDPEEQAGTELTYRLGDVPADWVQDLVFRARMAKSSRSGELASRAKLSFAAAGASVVTAPAAENVLRVVRDENELTMPEFVVHPHFPTFGAELSREDRTMLDELVTVLTVLKVERIAVTGHTDNVRIAPRNRKIYKDNGELSLARARSVGRYLLAALHLPPDKLTIDGKGETMPVADNRSEAGRAENRRVEIRVASSRLFDRSHLELTKPTSGPQKVETTALSAPVRLASAAGAGAMAPVPLPPPAVAPATSPVPAAPTVQPRLPEPEGILSPTDGSSLASRLYSVRINLSSLLKPRLLLDGSEVPGERIGFSMKDQAAGRTIYSYIGVDLGAPGEHILALQGVDPFGNVRFEKQARVLRTGEIAALRLLNADGNLADGKTPVRLRLQLLDADGKPIAAAAELEVKGGTLRPWLDPASAGTAPATATVQVDADGWVTFQPVMTSGPYRVALAHNRATLEAETYVKPMLRDWILVGLAEGTAGYKTVSGHLENLSASDTEEAFFSNSRLAFYAKGKIKGEWLLTMAYDTAKNKGVVGNSLFQTIDPNAFYTLYGDASQQNYDAASARKLYLKLERDRFYALFGDFDSGLTVTELSRYSRRFTGLKAELQTKDYEANLFGSETGQAFVKDEIRGDGTSGLYRLSRQGIVSNSEQITIEARDRFQSETVVSSRVLNRFIDYSIDYEAGTIFFKEPVASKDERFNPIFIVVDYETTAAGSSALTFGGRGGVKLLDGALKVGATYVHEGQVSGEGNLYGLDAAWNVGQGTRVRAEIATSNNESGSSKRDGSAYLAEVTHSGRELEAKAYYREQADGFGLGQQKGSETGTRKFGLDVAYKLTRQLTVGTQAYRQYNLATAAVRDFIEGRASYSDRQYSSRLGLRYANDQLGDGSNNSSTQLTAGGSWQTLNNRLTLRADHEQSLSQNNNADFPTRTTLGADLKATEAVTFFAQEELTYGKNGTTDGTRVGMKATPWKGGRLTSSMERQFNENDARLFANVGLAQTWQINEQWSVDGGLDRSQTLKKSQGYQFNVNVPPTSGGEDFTAVSLGATFKAQKLSWANRLEFRDGETEDKWGLVSGIVREQGNDWGWTGRLQLFHSQGAATGSSTSGDLRLGLAYRPPVTRWIVLDRLDLLYNKQENSTALTNSRRIVNNFLANCRPNRQTQLSLQYGAKYALETVDDRDYSGYTDLIGFEGRYDITRKWDVGLRGSLLHSWSVGQLSYSLGPSLGYNLMDNAWLSLGYNLVGFQDKDFSQGNFTSQGPFVNLRLKFDQNSVREAVQALGYQ